MAINFTFSNSGTKRFADANRRRQTRRTPLSPDLFYRQHRSRRVVGHHHGYHVALKNREEFF